MSDVTLFDPAATALILIDLQAGIVGLPLEPFDGVTVVRRCAGLADALRRRGTIIVYIRVDLAATGARPVDRPMLDPSAPPPREASELVPEAGRHEGDPVITKQGWGAFAATGLDEALTARGVRTIVLAGIATNIGVESTARAAADLGYEVIFVADAMTSISTDAHRFAVETIFPMLGRVRTTGEIEQAMES